MNPKVFISSTVEDLQPYREAAKEAVIRSSFFPVMQNYFPSSSGNPPLKTCLKKVDECAVLVVLIAHRYGWKPKDQPQTGTVQKSITWLECEQAFNNGKEVLPFVVDSEHQWPVEYGEDYRLTVASQAKKNNEEMAVLYTDVVESKNGLAAFKKWIDDNMVRCSFTNKDDLSSRIIHSLNEWRQTKQTKYSDGSNRNDGKQKRHGIPIIPQSYREWIEQNFRCIDEKKLIDTHMAPLSLPQIFIPLMTNPPSYDKSIQSITARQEESKPVAIERLITNTSSLLIEGHPGSGKTTILKHITYCLGSHTNPVGDDLKMIDGYIPLLLFLKDFNAFFKEREKGYTTCCSFQQLLTWYTKNKMGNKITFECIEHFIDNGTVLLMLDGLDELHEEHRDRIVNVFADALISDDILYDKQSQSGNKLVITSRPKGITGAAKIRFTNNRVSINALLPKQQYEFIRKWFAFFYPGECGPGGRTSEAMINEMKIHPAIDRLADNPLMLTAICILYHNNNELPAQRAELYYRFINNMLYRRFPIEFERISSFMRILGFTMHTARVKEVDRDDAIKCLKNVYKKEPEEDDTEYNSRIGSKFDEIESQCGLIQTENGCYKFWHLTYQEFLCASYLADNSDNKVTAINSFWEDFWYYEVIELYIGLLSVLNNKKNANKIVKNAFRNKSTAEYRSWLIAAHGLYDIHKDRRDEETEALVLKSLQIIMKSEISRKIRAEAGELLGWLGDPRDDLRDFVAISGGEYSLEGFEKIIKIPAFEIGKYPVTNSWYEKFVQADGYTNKEYWSDEGWQWRKKNNVKYPGYWHNRVWKCPNAPVVGVSWYEADAFARWLTVTRNDGFVYRLPGQGEWQAAAAGFEGRKYPWGDEWDYTRCNCVEGDDTIGKTSSVGIFERGKTPDGIYDMAGNVWEWFSTCSGESRVVRGGSWLHYSHRCRCAGRYGYWPGIRYNSAGFRLSRGHKRTSQDR